MTDLVSKAIEQQREAERLFAGAAFVAPDIALQDCSWLSPDSFLDQRIGDFWRMLLDGKDNIAASFDAQLQPVMLDWQNQIVSALAVKEYAEEIAKYRYLYTAALALTDLATAIGTGEVEGVHRIAEQLANKRLAIARTIPTVEDINLRFIDAVVGDQRSILTGIPALDDATGGLERQTLSVLAARPSMGKTALAFQIGRTAAGPGSHTVAIFSLEMSSVSLWARAACPLIGVSWLDVRKKTLTQEQEGELLRQSADLAVSYCGRLMIDDDSNHTTETLWRICATIHPDLVLVDHMDLLKDVDDNNVRRLGTISGNLKSMAKQLDCHVMAVHQLSRAVEERPDKRPLLRDLRASGLIEQNADQVFMLYNDSYYTGSAPIGGITPVEIWIRKFRDGARNVVIELGFSEEKQYFYPVRSIPLNKEEPGPQADDIPYEPWIHEQ